MLNYSSASTKIMHPTYIYLQPSSTNYLVFFNFTKFIQWFLIIFRTFYGTSTIGPLNYSFMDNPILLSAITQDFFDYFGIIFLPEFQLLYDDIICISFVIMAILVLFWYPNGLSVCPRKDILFQAISLDLEISNNSTTLSFGISIIIPAH